MISVFQEFEVVSQRRAAQQVCTVAVEDVFVEEMDLEYIATRTESLVDHIVAVANEVVVDVATFVSVKIIDSTISSQYVVTTIADQNIV